MPKTKATGAQGVFTNLNGKTGRAIVEKLTEHFTVAGDRHRDVFSATACVNLRTMYPEEAKPGENGLFIYTDNTKYLQIWAPKRFMTTLRNDFNKIVKYYEEANKPSLNPAYPLLENERLQDFVGNLPVPAVSVWRDEAVGKVMATKAEAKPKEERFKVKVPKDRDHANAVTELALTAWEVLAEWPKARDILMNTMVHHGAQIKPEENPGLGSSIAKEETGEWIFVGDSELVKVEPGTHVATSSSSSSPSANSAPASPSMNST